MQVALLARHSTIFVVTLRLRTTRSSCSTRVISWKEVRFPRDLDKLTVAIYDGSMSWFDQRPDDAMDGAFTLVGPDTVRTCEPAAFREAMSRLGAAVHVITTAGPGGKTGATATAVCSVSDAPPTLLMCLNRRSQTNPVVVENGVFCVNTLGDGGAQIADTFAGRTGVQGTDRFAVGNWTVLSTGSPVLASAVIAFDCRIVEVRAVASHNVFFGAVETVRLGPAGPALVYHERAYKRV
jgi:flavin reductase (DIM6/NTAB) family NADH-FMN oxidoreductase RutF